MRKRWLAFVLAACMAVPMLAVPAGAAGTTEFSDVSDRGTALAIETLRLMGVLSGYGDGTFRPDAQLNRAQFCKMAVHAMDGAKELGLYQTVTVFPDVKPSYWAAGYINLAAKGKGIIAGFTDGKFHPERTVTVGQAVTILLRLLGYKDENVGGVWPDSYMAVGATAGLTEGMEVNGNAPLTRGQAAKLFVNLLRAKGPEGGTIYTLSGETELISLDGGAGTIKTSGGTYPMAVPAQSTSLVGARGHVVMAGTRALTFLPLTEGNAGTASSAVVVYADHSGTGFSALAGNNSYTIYKNGVPTGLQGLRKYDVATYSAATNSIRVCDTRVTVYYEACDPSPKAPTKITVLGGTEFSVLPSARDMLAQFNPGDRMTLLLTADGQVAGAVAPTGTVAQSNAVGIVTGGGVQMLCGTITIPLAGAAGDELLGQVVRITAASQGQVNLAPLSSGAFGELDVKAGTLGGKSLAANVTVYSDGALIGFSQLTDGLAGRVLLYARTNWAGDVDLIILGDRLRNVYYGRTIVTESEEAGEMGSRMVVKVNVEYAGGSSGAYETTLRTIRTGDYVMATLNRTTGRFSSIVPLTKLQDVSSGAWTGESIVTAGGQTYSVGTGVSCYNRDTGSWMPLTQALAYADKANLYAHDGVIRIVEVGG